MILLDTSFLLSVEVEGDSNHNKAVHIRDEIVKGAFGAAAITDYIFDETVTVTFGRTKNLGKAVLIGDSLKSASEVLKVDEADIEHAWKLFKNQKSTKLSFTDCTTLAVMKRNSIENIATFDDDFKKIEGTRVVQ